MGKLGKLTQKNIKYGLQLNVNDEASPAYKVLDNVDTSKKLGSLKQRTGIMQSDITGFNTDTVTSSKQITAGIRTEINLTAFKATDNTSNFSFVYTADMDINLKFFKMILWYLGTKPTVKFAWNIYEWSLSKGIKGALLSTTDEKEFLLPDIRYSYKYTLNSNITLENGKSYLFSIKPSIPITDTNIYTYIRPDINNIFNVIENVIPTKPSIYTKSYNIFDIYLYYAQAIQKGFSTDIMSVQNEGSKYYISNLLNNSGASFGFGALDMFDNSVRTSNILNPSGVNFPACYYGFKVIDNIHQYVLGLGSQLQGKTDNLKDYRMVKKPKDNNYFIEVMGDTDAVITGVGTHLGEKRDDFDGLSDGEYEYVVEFIGRDGRPYKNSNTLILWSGTKPYYYNKNDISKVDIKIFRPSTPATDKNLFSFVNLYRRLRRQKNEVDNLEATLFFKTTLDDSNFDNDELCWKYTDTTNTVSQNIFEEKDYYYPRPADMALYKDKLICAGDKEYTNYIFPARDYKDDFWFTDIYAVTFPEGDKYFTAVETLNDDCFAFSKHGIWRIRQTSATAPLFAIQQVSDKVGCITTSKGIVKAFGKMYFLSADGLVEFDGYAVNAIDVKVNNIFNIDFNDTLTQTGGTPSLTVGHVHAFGVQAVYNPDKNSIIFMIPDVNSFDISGIYEFSLKSREWNTITLTGVKGLWSNDDKNRAGFYTLNNIYEFSNDLTKDYYISDLFNGVYISMTAEMDDINFDERTQFKLLRLYGVGTCTVEVFLDREETATSTFTDINLNEDGTKSIELPLGWTGNYYRHKITASGVDDFELKGFELVYYNDGVKKFRSVAE
jgi:hypothetical protein